jgi:hypothetical protein
MNPISEESATIATSTTTYRAAMALNNLGVSMMEQGPLHHAIRLFKESFAVMSSEHRLPRDAQFGDVFLPVSQDQEPSSASSRWYQVTQERNMVPSLHPFEVCPCDDDNVAFQTSTLFCVRTFVPIHLRSQHFCDTHDNASLALAIIMYNHGLAHLLAHAQDKRYTSAMGYGSTTTPLGRKLLRGAFVALHCSQVMINRHLNAIDKSGNGCHQKDFEKLEASVVSAMTLKTMMWMSRMDSQGKDHAEQAGAMFLHVLADIEYYQYQLRKLDVNMGQHPTSTATAA